VRSLIASEDKSNKPRSAFAFADFAYAGGTILDDDLAKPAAELRIGLQKLMVRLSQTAESLRVVQEQSAGPDEAMQEYLIKLETSRRDLKNVTSKIGMADAAMTPCRTPRSAPPVSTMAFF
jgi:hypothetical protein